MAIQEKTIRYGFPLLASLSDATVTNLTQITVAIPENVIAFRSVTLQWSGLDIVTATGGTWTEHRSALRLGAAAYTTITNLNDVTNSGENLSALVANDFTAHFTSNWSGTSMTCDAQVYVDQSTGTTLGLRDVAAELIITYSYDDTSTTHVKTVFVPLATFTGAHPTSKPGTAQATIPALDTYLPEASKTYRDCYIVFQGNEAAAGTTDFTLSHEIDTNGVVTTGTIERALASDRWNRWIHSKFSGGSVGFTTNATHDLFWWASAAQHHHPQAYMVVTYEFDPSASSTVIAQSLLLPMEFASPAGNSASTWLRAQRELWIQEPGTITAQQSALLLFWEQAAPIAGLNLRLATSGGFTAFTDTASMLAGGNGCQLLTTPTLARGRNTLSADVYVTDTADLLWNVSGLWIINYTSDRHADGPSAHAQTRVHNVLSYGTGAASTNSVSASAAPTITPGDYFLIAVGVHAQYVPSGTAATGIAVHAERTSGEGGFAWESVYADSIHTDLEVGLRQAWATARSLFRRWTGDPASERMDLETARRWKMSTSANTFSSLDLYLTYHTITYTIAGTISSSDGGTVTIHASRADTGERIASTTRTGDGAYSVTWYDDTEDLRVTASDASGNAGASAVGVAS